MLLYICEFRGSGGGERNALLQYSWSHIPSTCITDLTYLAQQRCENITLIMCMKVWLLILLEICSLIWNTVAVTSQSSNINEKICFTCVFIRYFEKKYQMATKLLLWENNLIDNIKFKIINNLSEKARKFIQWSRNEDEKPANQSEIKKRSY